jgi:RNA polymerase sigma factor (sigma-70 family)
MTNREQEERFAAILSEYDKPLQRLAFAYERDADLRRDLLQEIRLALWRALPTFRNEASERTFVYRVAHNRALTQIAKRHPEQLSLSIALDRPDSSPDPEETVASKLQEAELRAKVSALPLVFRQVVSLALEGLSNREIGDVIGITEGNVAVRLTRAKRLLRIGGAR